MAWSSLALALLRIIGWSIEWSIECVTEHAIERVILDCNIDAIERVILDCKIEHVIERAITGGQGERVIKDAEQGESEHQRQGKGVPSLLRRTDSANENCANEGSANENRAKENGQCS